MDQKIPPVVGFALNALGHILVNFFFTLSLSLGSIYYYASHVYEVGFNYVPPCKLKKEELELCLSFPCTYLSNYSLASTV